MAHDTGAGIDDNANAIRLVVALIPAGRVATYGQIAALAGIPRNARQVGAVLSRLSEGSDLPWFRVVNSKGEISPRGDGGYCHWQRERLEHEGIEFSGSGRISLTEYGWRSSNLTS